MKVQGQSYSETPLEYYQDQIPWEPKIAYVFLSNLRVTGSLCSFRLVVDEKTGKELPDSARPEFLENF